MRAIVIREPGGPEVLELHEVADPEPAADELLVRVRATALNRADTLQRRGQYNPPPGSSPILGLELAGTVERAGAEVTGFAPGQRVMALVTGGSYAELAAFPAAMAVPIPERFSFEQAAAIPEAFTAMLNLFVLGDLQPGQRVLIHAGASGVGSAAIQLAREAGATVYATAGSAEKLDLCRRLGAALAINYKEDAAFDERVLEHSDGQGVNLVLDFIGAPYWDRNLNALAMHGRLALIGMMGGSRGSLDIGKIMGKRIVVTGTTLRATPLPQKIALVERLRAFALPRLLDGRLVPTVDRVFPLAEAAAAHRYMESNANSGKIILSVGDSEAAP